MSSVENNITQGKTFEIREKAKEDYENLALELQQQEELEDALNKRINGIQEYGSVEP